MAADDVRQELAARILDAWRIAPDDATFGQLADRFADASLPTVDRIAREAAGKALNDAADLAAKDHVPAPCWTGQDVAVFLRALAEAADGGGQA